MRWLPLLGPGVKLSRTILITGATSGIGRSLALRSAREGVTLALMGRDQGRLASVAQECRVLGAAVHSACLDVCDRVAMAQWIIELDRNCPLDLVIANAGLMAGTPPHDHIEPPDKGYQVIETNVLGVLNTVQPLLGPMINRGRGQIAIISSVAGFLPVPDSPSYGASKAAVLNYGLALRTLLAKHGIAVSVVCPGYVDTPMMRREKGAKPFQVSPDRAADLILTGLARNRAIIAFPFLFATMTRMHGLFPDRVRRWLSMRFRFTVMD